MPRIVNIGLVTMNYYHVYYFCEATKDNYRYRKIVLNALTPCSERNIAIH